ncbi:MAG: glycosyltransferase [Myxococcota bacterium]
MSQEETPGRHLRVLHLSTGLGLGGAETLLAQLLGALDDGFEHRVISLEGRSVVGATLVERGVRVETLELQHWSGRIRAPARLTRVLRSFRPDLLHGWMYHANLVAILTGLATRLPVICGLHSASLDSGLSRRSTRVVARVGGSLARLAACVVSCSEAGVSFHRELGYPREKIRVIPNGIDTATFRPTPTARAELRAELGLAPQAFLVGMVARPAPVKNHALFLRAARKLLDQVEGATLCHFVLCGTSVDAGNPGLRGGIEELGLNGHTHLLGPRLDIARIHAGLDVLASCSDAEAFPLVVGEAMASGTPCVVTDVGDCARIVGDTGRVVAPGDAAGMAAAWLELRSIGSAGREALGRRARARIERRFSLARMATRYAALYRELVREGPGLPR